VTSPDGDITPKRDWSRADWPSFSIFCDYLSSNTFYLNCINANDYWQVFSDFLNTGISMFVPFLNVSRVRGIKHQPHIISNLLAIFYDEIE